MRYFLPFCFVFAVFVSHAQTPHAQTLGFTFPEGRKRIDIPFQVHNNLIVVNVLINDALPLKFIVDTGVRTAILTQKIFTDILNLPYSRKFTIAGPGGNKILEAFVTNNVSINLYGINGAPAIMGRGHTMLVLENDPLQLRNYLGVDVHGILGYELFSRFVIRIDYKRKLMTLYAPDKFHPGKKYQEIPMAIEDTKPFIVTPVQVDVNNTLAAKLLIDTGASHGLLLDPGSDKRILVPSKHVSTELGRALGGIIMGKIGRIETLELGKASLHNVLVNFPDSNSYYDTLIHALTFRNGSLGGEVLSRFTAVFNFPQGKLYLKKNSDFKKAFYFNLSGLDLKAKGSRLNTYEVIRVGDQSPASEAGLQEGDVIISINGMLAEDLRLSQMNGLLNSVPGRKIVLEVNRNNIKQKIVFRLKSML